MSTALGKGTTFFCDAAVLEVPNDNAPLWSAAALERQSTHGMLLCDGAALLVDEPRSRKGGVRWSSVSRFSSAAHACPAEGGEAKASFCASDLGMSAEELEDLVAAGRHPLAKELAVLRESMSAAQEQLQTARESLELLPGKGVRSSSQQVQGGGGSLGALLPDGEVGYDTLVEAWLQASQARSPENEKEPSGAELAAILRMEGYEQVHR